MLRRVLTAASILYLYYVHLPVLRLLGPRCAIPVARLLAWLHWLLTFAGLERRPRQALTRALSEFRTSLTVSTILRRYLELKHQNMAEWHLAPTRRGRCYLDQTYRDIEGKEYLDDAIREGKGAILLVFHFGVCRMALLALKHLGYEPHLHLFRESPEAANTFDWVLRASNKAWERAEQASGMKIVFHRPLMTFTVLARILGRGEIVSMNGDGLGAESTDFVEVPFLGGTIALPNGPARLAARTGAPIVPLFSLLEGRHRHRLIVHPPLRCHEDSPEQVQATVANYVALLEDYVRRYPWAWWIWRRLEVTRQPYGQRRYRLAVFSTPQAVSKEKFVVPASAG